MSVEKPMAISHVAVQVPDPGATADFYQRVFGLAVTGRDDGEIRLSAAPSHRTTLPAQELVLKQGPTPSIDHIAFSIADEEQIEAWLHRLRWEDLPDVEVKGPEKWEAGSVCGLRLEDPDGRTVELCVDGPEVMRLRGEVPFEATHLGHVTFRSPSPSRLSGFYRSVLGFRVSDQLADHFFWLRCNRDHHTVAVTQSHGNPAGLHHIAFEVLDWDEIRRLCDHFLQEGVQVEFGPGRHGPGNNIFVYVLDPNGIRFEFFCDLLRIDDEESYVPKQWEGGRQRNANRWGPQPPESFLRG